MAIYPCKGCKKRERLCHSTCEEYKEAKARREAGKEAERRAMQIDIYEVERYRKSHDRWVKTNRR